MTLTITHIFQLCSFALLLSCGQILFKYSATTTPSIAGIEGMISLFLNMWFWAALVLYGIATLIWIFILQQVPLSLAYPFVALGFIIVPVASHFLFKEPINLYYALGTLMIIGGLGVITVLATR